MYGCGHDGPSMMMNMIKMTVHDEFVPTDQLTELIDFTQVERELEHDIAQFLEADIEVLNEGDV